MRILHILDHSIPLHSGYTFRTLALLREQRRLGWQTFHLTSPKQLATGGLEETVDGWHFYRTPAANAPRWPGLAEAALMRQTQQRLLAVSAAVRPDILHAHSPVLNAMPALRVGRALGIPVVYEVRAFWEDAAVDHGTTTEGSLRYRLTRRLETHALRRPAHVFTICEGLRRDIVARGIAADKVTVIPNAVDIEAFEPGGAADEALKARAGPGRRHGGRASSAASTPTRAWTCCWTPAGCCCAAARRARAAGRRRPAGRGAEGAGRAAWAWPTRWCSPAACRTPRCSATTTWSTCWPTRATRMRLTELVTPLKPLEAMAQGRLLVASDVGGHRELIRDGETGVLFKAGSADALAGSRARPAGATRALAGAARCRRGASSRPSATGARARRATTRRSSSALVQPAVSVAS